jgi:excisionase family DNA binding protein
MDDLLKAGDIAQRLRVSADTVRRWAREGRIPEVHLSRKVRRFREAEVLAALETLGVRPKGVRDAS